MTDNEHRAKECGYRWRMRLDPRAPWGYVGPYYYDDDDKPVLSSQLTKGERAAFAMGVTQAVRILQDEGAIEPDD